MKLTIILLTFFCSPYIFANENDPYNRAYDSNNVGFENNEVANDAGFDSNEQSRQPSNYNEGYEDSSNGSNQHFTPFEPE